MLRLRSFGQALCYMQAAARPRCRRLIWLREAPATIMALVVVVAVEKPLDTASKLQQTCNKQQNSTRTQGQCNVVVVVEPI